MVKATALNLPVAGVCGRVCGDRVLVLVSQNETISTEFVTAWDTPERVLDPSTLNSWKVVDALSGEYYPTNWKPRAFKSHKSGPGRRY